MADQEINFTEEIERYKKIIDLQRKSLVDIVGKIKTHSYFDIIKYSKRNDFVKNIVITGSESNRINLEDNTPVSVIKETLNYLTNYVYIEEITTFITIRVYCFNDFSALTDDEFNIVRCLSDSPEFLALCPTKESTALPVQNTPSVANGTATSDEDNKEVLTMRERMIKLITGTKITDEIYQGVNEISKIAIIKLANGAMEWALIKRLSDEKIVDIYTCITLLESIRLEKEKNQYLPIREVIPSEKLKELQSIMANASEALKKLSDFKF